MSEIVGLGLFSGGLDSILACRVIEAQGIKVIGLKFVTPFFDHELLGDKIAYQADIYEKYGIRVELVDLSEGYIRLLENPVHGFGKNFNPCIDCKILMMSRARKLMDDYGASFLISGEVIGQRPMSQRRDTLRIIERDSGCDGILLRPLSAKNLDPTTPEIEGIVDRSKLFDFSGRSRKPQMSLAREFGISEYPSPAGGCVLTDEKLAKRIRYLYSGKIDLDGKQAVANDIHCLLVGRQFLLEGKYWLIIGRNSEENEQLEALRLKSDWVFGMVDRPGPKALLKNGSNLTGTGKEERIIEKIGGMVVRYGKQVKGERPPADIYIDMGEKQEVKTVSALSDEQFKADQIT